jgi:4-amino-4-deoxy-L-arabinose transferase-like glycosyltransferase
VSDSPTNAGSIESSVSPLATLREHGSLLAAIVAAVSVRIAIVMAFPDMPLVGDEHKYFEESARLADGLPIGAFRPPLYLFFSMLVIEVAGPFPDAIRLSQCLLEGLGVIGMFLLGVAAAGRRTGLWAAWIFALFPDFIGYSHYLWSESLATFVLIAALLLLWRLHDRPSWPAAAGAGFALGLASLIKPYHLYLAPILLGCTVLCCRSAERPFAKKLAAGAMLATLVVVLSWSIHATLKHGRPILISTTGALNLTDGTNYYRPPQYDFPRFHKKRSEVVAAMGRTEGLVSFVVSNPALFAARAGEKMGYLWSPNSYVIRHLYIGKYGAPQKIERWQRLLTSYTVMAATALVLLLAIPGAFASRGSFLFYVTTAYVVPYTLMITITPSLSRYRLPLMVFAVLHAACLLGRGGAAPRQLARREVWIPTLVLWGALAVAWGVRLPEVVAALW